MRARFNTPDGVVRVVITKYPDSNLAVKLENTEHEPLATLSVNIPDQAHTLWPGEFFAKVWMENIPLAYAALASGLFEDTGRRIHTGFVIAPVWKVAYEWCELCGTLPLPGNLLSEALVSMGPRGLVPMRVCQSCQLCRECGTRIRWDDPTPGAHAINIACEHPGG